MGIDIKTCRAIDGTESTSWPVSGTLGEVKSWQSKNQHRLSISGIELLSAHLWTCIARTNPPPQYSPRMSIQSIILKMYSVWICNYTFAYSFFNSMVLDSYGHDQIGPPVFVTLVDLPALQSNVNLDFSQPKQIGEISSLHDFWQWDSVLVGRTTIRKDIGLIMSFR